MQAAKTQKEGRTLPSKLGAKVTAEADGGAAKREEDDSTHHHEKETLSKDSMRLSSLGDWLSNGKEQKVTKEEKVGYIGGILAGVGDEDEESSSEEELQVPAPKTAVMQLEELSDSVETLLVSLVVCRRRTRFLCIQELDGTWYIPGGTVAAGESFEGAAMRSAQDEANVTIALEGILRIEYSTSNGVRVRLVFKAQPQDPTILPKQIADDHSLQAKWLSGVALKKFRLRTDHILEMFDYVDSAGDGENPDESECPCFPLSIMECPPFGPERCQMDPNQSVTLLVHKAHLVLVDRKKKVFVLPDKSLPTMVLKEGTSFLRFPTIMVNKYCGLFGLDTGNHPCEVLHVWHAPPNPLDAVGMFAVTYVQKVRSEFSGSCNFVTLDNIKQLKAVPAIRNRIKLMLKADNIVPTMPLNFICAEGEPWKLNK